MMYLGRQIMSNKLEVRSFSDLEIRDGDDSVTVVGYASVFDQETVIWDEFREVVRKGAFSEAVNRDDVQLLVNHDGLPLARTTSNTLTLTEDATGLRMESKLDISDPDVARIIPKMKRGDLSKMSFAFRVKEQRWTDHDNAMPLRELLDLELSDVSIVSTPAYDGTSVSLRAEARGIKEAAKENIKVTQSDLVRLRMKQALVARVAR